MIVWLKFNVLLIPVWLKATVVGEVKLTVGLIGSAIDNSITSLAVLPDAGIVSPSSYLPKVFPSDKDTVRSVVNLASVPDIDNKLEASL